MILIHISDFSISLSFPLSTLFRNIYLPQATLYNMVYMIFNMYHGHKKVLSAIVLPVIEVCTAFSHTIGYC